MAVNMLDESARRKAFSAFIDKRKPEWTGE